MPHISKDITDIAKEITVAAVTNPNFFVPSMRDEVKISIVVNLYKEILQAVKDTIEK